MKNLFFIILCFCFSSCISNAQDTPVFVIYKTDLKKYGIENIKALNCKAFIEPYSVEAKNSSGAFEETDTYTIHFTNGRLTEINSNYISYIKYDYLDSLYLEWWKQRKAYGEKTSKYMDSLLNASLTNVNGFYIHDRDGGGNRNIWPCFTYEYQGNLKSISVDDCTDNTREFVSEINFYYNENAKIQWSKLAYSEDTIITHYLYKENSLVGYYPAKQRQSLPADSIYSPAKLQELQKIGFDSFKKKYFTPEVYKKVIEDCYEPVKNSQLLINNKSITEFLNKIGKNGMKYIVFEITDNYFLFYKIID